MGRGRKAGDRYPSGKLKPGPKPSEPWLSGAEWQRLRQLAKKAIVDPRLGSELGRLHACGELTIVQTTAGQRVGEIYRAFEREHGQRRFTKSPSYERTFGRGPSDDDAADVERDFLRLQKTLDELAPAPSPIKTRGGVAHRKHYLVDALERLCVEDRAISPALYPEMRSLLEAIALRYGITSVKRPRAGSSKPQIRKPSTAEAPTPRVNVDRATWSMMLLELRPDLSPKEAERLYEIAQACKARELFNRSKPKPPPAENPAVAGVRVKLDRPMLTLPEEERDAS